MLDHVGILVADWAKSKAFYDAAFAALGYRLLAEIPVEHTGGVNVGGYGRDKPDFWLTESTDTGPGRHYAFVAANHAEVDAFYAAAMANGGRDNGGPGPRPHYHAHYYGAFVIDPDGNNVEAVCHAPG
ncbi:MAG: VOC family protein [Devosia sp.]|jgi:catechol 2,3-dioxygenase-like lactoylglutathione lyase family enzyme|uniref:VOC family protein n=1 Tax=unclassified Devosia TaxID=196773 RepID=UPI0019DA64C6|nr:MULTISPECIES: VOC family protein [unclassified Devosia]MBF0678392.1 VOC family protein [Devosia sp.]WEJ32313.1 VOC family protein [Devosia sp. SD17-2]